MADILAQNIDARHTQNFSDYWAMLSSLLTEQINFIRELFSQSMMGLPYSCQPLDMWIETTMNLKSKLKQGWLNLLQNQKQFSTTIRNVNNIDRVKSIVK